jgi:hypothetical protein
MASKFIQGVWAVGKTILKGGKQKTTGKEVITKFKPKPTKGESTKVWGQKLRGPFKKTTAEIEENLNKVLTSTNRLLQKVKGEKVTKSGISKGKDIK